MKLTKKLGFLLGGISLLVVFAITVTIILISGGYLKASGQGRDLNMVSKEQTRSQVNDDGTVTFEWTANEVAKIRYQMASKADAYFDITDKKTIDVILSNYKGIVYENKKIEPGEERLGLIIDLECFDQKGNKIVAFSSVPYMLKIEDTLLYTKGYGLDEEDILINKLQDQLNDYMVTYKINSDIANNVS